MKSTQADVDALRKLMKALETKGLVLNTARDPRNGTAVKFDIREEVGSDGPVATKGKRRVAHRPKSKPKGDAFVNLPELREGNGNKVLSVEELWAKLDEWEKREEHEEEQQKREKQDTSSSSEKNKGSGALRRNTLPGPVTNVDRDGAQALSSLRETEEEEEDGSEGSSSSRRLPSIYFSHTAEPGKAPPVDASNKTTPKNSHHVTSPADFCRLFVDTRKSKPVPVGGKSLRNQENQGNGVYSRGDSEEPRTTGRSRETETSSSVPVARHPPGRLQVFSEAVVEKDPLATVPPVLPTAVPERKRGEVTPDAASSEDCTEQVSKFKAARLQRMANGRCLAKG